MKLPACTRKYIQVQFCTEVTSPKLSSRMGLPGKQQEQIQPTFEKVETALAYSIHS